jgi:hypothetical protein
MDTQREDEERADEILVELCRLLLGWGREREWERDQEAGRSESPSDSRSDADG